MGIPVFPPRYYCISTTQETSGPPDLGRHHKVEFLR
jgi:hypothetical protein